MDRAHQARALSREFIELCVAAPRREGPSPDTRPEDLLRGYLTAIDVASVAVFAPGRQPRRAHEGANTTPLDEWELAVWIAEGLLRHGLTRNIDES